MNGYIESDAKVQERWSRRTFEAAKVETCLRQTTEAEADRLHELVAEAEALDVASTPAEVALWDVIPDANELKLGNVVFDIPALADNIRQYSAVLKARIDARAKSAQERMGTRH